MKHTEGMNLGEKISYYWYYYKWHAFAVVCAIIAVVITVVSCLNQVDPDLSVMVVSDVFVDSEYQQKFENEYSKYIEDVNGDGKKVIDFTVVQFSNYTTGTMNPELEAASEEHLKVNLMTAQNQLIIFKDNVKDYLESFGTFTSLKQYDNDLGYFKVDEDDMALLDLSTNEYNVCIRVTPTKAKDEELKMYNNAHKVLRQMIN
ncbi:MAG: hypothetical protein PHE51_02400 [Eubacteriales bacterium]|nr:hypothetical protein [Eubacteriales bacterium]